MTSLSSMDLPASFRSLSLCLALSPYGDTLLHTQLNTLHLYSAPSLRLTHSLPQSDIIHQAVYSPISFGPLLGLVLNNGVIIVLQKTEG